MKGYADAISETSKITETKVLALFSYVDYIYSGADYVASLSQLKETKMQESAKFKGVVDIVLTDENGNIKHQETVENLIVTGGLAHIASRMIGAGQAVMSHVGVGTGTTAAAAGQTTLEAETARSLSTLSHTSTTYLDDTVQHSATFPAGRGTGPLTEAGIFNASTGGTMLNRTVFSVVNKAASDTLTVTWRIKIA